MEQLHVRAFKA